MKMGKPEVLRQRDGLLAAMKEILACTRIQTARVIAREAIANAKEARGGKTK